MLADFSQPFLHNFMSPVLTDMPCTITLWVFFPKGTFMHEIERVWKILELKGTATLDDVKKQYKNLVKKYHPDRYQNPEEKKQAEARFKEINATYHYMMQNFDKFFCRKSDLQKREEENEQLNKELREIYEFLKSRYGDCETEDFDTEAEELDEREFFRKYYPEIDDAEFLENYASPEYLEKYAQQYHCSLEDFPEDEEYNTWKIFPLWIKILLITSFFLGVCAILF